MAEKSFGVTEMSPSHACPIFALLSMKAKREIISYTLARNVHLFEKDARYLSTNVKFCDILIT